MFCLSKLGRLGYAGLAIILRASVSRGGILCKWQRRLNFVMGQPVSAGSPGSHFPMSPGF